MRINISKNIRILNNNNQYIVINTKRNNEHIINEEMYNLLNDINNKSYTLDEFVKSKSYELAVSHHKVFNKLEELIRLDIITLNSKHINNKNVLSKYIYGYSLDSLSIEVTNKCNLKCVHCYGKFDKCTSPKEISYNYLKSLIKYLNVLNTKNIALTGGEFFCHSKHQQIFDLFITNGFTITIFTNGFDLLNLKEFLSKTSMYFFNIKISIDGFEHTHNLIRQNPKAYYNVMKSVELIASYSNIYGLASFTINKLNYKETDQFLDFAQHNIPLPITTDIAFTTKFNYNDDIFFNIKDLDQCWHYLDSYKNLLLKLNKENNKSYYRCSGGIKAATLTYDKKLKICNAAQNEEYYFGDVKTAHNVIKIWENPPENIIALRKELTSSISLCNKCKKKDSCKMVNCRLLAEAFTGNRLNPNPLICKTMMG
ncbi:MAG: radical SAM protein [Acholeplasmataceae bacterium]|jgi:MoaA/NifB/PqqE/SkfB family radical SAM enzyme|nr:radical SAM protein [Acholeplasmataceae bacterium]